MPLLDHFHAPLSLQRPWEGIHSAWAAALAAQLNRDLLPPDYFAMPQVTVGVRVESDVGTFRSSAPAGNGALATAIWAPPAPPLSAQVDFVGLQTIQVQILQEMGGAKLRGVIELVSPANKDRASHRRAFVIKCASYLQQGIGLVVVDVVTERKANLHAQLLEVLQVETLTWQSATGLYAVAYRAAPWSDGDRLDVWPEELSIGQVLPQLPLWIAEDFSIPVPLEESYTTTLDSLRIQH